VAHYQRDPGINRIEWKTRAHDHAPGLHDALLNNGFTPDEPESIMIGEAHALAVDVSVPAGVRLRRVTSEADVRAMCAMQAAVFEDPTSDDVADAMLRRLTLHDGMELWVAESQGQIVSAGRLEPVRGSQFAGNLGRRDHVRMAWPRHLAGADRSPGQVGAADGQNVYPQRLDRILAADPRTLRPDPRLHDHAVPLETVRPQRSVRSGECSIIRLM
jgi:hypothetical protein